LCLRGGDNNVRHEVGAEENEAAVVDLEPVPVERTHGRAGRAVPLGVELASVAGTAVAGGDDRDDLDRAVRRALLDRRLAEDLAAGAVRLRRAADVRAA